MDLLLVAALAFGLGLLAGIGVGAARAFRLASQRRAVAGANAGIARLWPETLPTRSAADILSGRVRVVLGGRRFDLPVLPRRASREWLETLDQHFAGLADDLDQAADDKPRILALLAGESTGLLEILRAYDQSGILPSPDYIDDFATDAEILLATLEVWRAANPLPATLAAAMDDDPTSGIPSEPSSLPVPPTAGPLPTSSAG